MALIVAPSAERSLERALSELRFCGEHEIAGRFAQRQVFGYVPLVGSFIDARKEPWISTRCDPQARMISA